MTIRTIAYTIFLFIGLHAAAQEQISLNGNWQFALAKTESEVSQLKNFFEPNFKATEFKSIPVPSNWAVLGYEEPVYRGFEGDKASEGFYLHQFTIPKDWGGKRLLLQFGGVWSSAEVWLNGAYIGKHESGYTSFAFEVSGKLKTDTINMLAVRVRQVSREYKFDVYDDWTLGGIFRDVTLEAMPRKRWLESTVTKTTFDNNFLNADLEIRCLVTDRSEGSLPGNYPSPGNPYNLRFTLLSTKGEKVASRQLTVPAHVSTSRETITVIPVESPLHWTAETPNLYNLKIELLENDKVVQSSVERIGFRQISTEGGIFRINGQAVKLRGVNRHDEHPDVGRATTREHWLQDIMLMKAANINYVRAAHYQHAKGFIELCDELGMYVGEEVSLGGAGNLINDPSYSGPTLVRSYETVSRDINNPSIIYWSMGNEDALASLNLTAVRFVKSMDPTRPVLIPWRYETWLPKDIDILSVHYWHPREYDSLASIANRPIITTEYTHAFGLDGFGGLEARWKALTKHPQGAGGAIWMWADQGIKTPVKKPAGKYDRIVKDDDYLRIDDAGWDGIVDSYRKPTRDYYETKAVYAPVYPAMDRVSFYPGQSVVAIPIQNDFDFTNLNSVTIEWTIKDDDKDVASGTSNISGEPHTVSNLELAVDKLKIITAGHTAYVWLRFIDASKKEIIQRSVELIPHLRQNEQTLRSQKIAVKQGDSLIVSVNNVSYAFNPTTGQLLSASVGGKKLISDLRPIIWHKPDRGESSVIGSKIAGKLPDLNNYIPKVKQWEVRETAASVTIQATVEYVINDKNRFTAKYQYQVETDGQLLVHYEILPKVETPSLPIVGMVLQSVPELDKLHWLGLGPYDAYPNKQSAPMLGVWGGVIKSDEVNGNKQTRWIELSGSNGKVHISNEGYMDHDVSNPQVVQVLSSVLGKPEKGRKPDESVLLLETNTGKPFVGEFSVALLNPLDDGSKADRQTVLAK